VRIKSGIYKGDLGIIDLVYGNKKALVRIIPRISNDQYQNSTNAEIKTLFSLKNSPYI
jgi:hypothetical protein